MKGVTTEGSAVNVKKMIPIKLASANEEEEIEDRLLRQGWKRLTTIGEPRLSEIAEAYRGMGFEVHVETYKSEGDGCNTCLDADQEMGKIIGTVYTRRAAVPQKDDELF
uniref:Uncharacterized protein n=2 Tax=Aromatoleum TaxID=551759 RepID=A0ABX1PHP2_9RHOO